MYQGFLAIARHASLSFSSSHILSVAVNATNEATHTFDAGNQLLGSPVVELGFQEMILGQGSADAILVQAGTAVKLAVALHHFRILAGVRSFGACTAKHGMRMQTLPSFPVIFFELVFVFDESASLAAHEVFGGIIAQLNAAIETQRVLTTADAVCPNIFGSAVSVKNFHRLPHLLALRMFVSATPTRKSLLQHPCPRLALVLTFGLLELLPSVFGICGSDGTQKHIQQKLRTRQVPLSEEVWTISLHQQEFVC